MKKTIAQLSNDKKMLVCELQQAYDGQNRSQGNEVPVGNYRTDPTNENANSSILNESSIEHSKLEFIKQTANFQNVKPRSSHTGGQGGHKTKLHSTQEETKNEGLDGLEDMSKARLVELLRSTSEYRQFVYYYDSHELSYLKRLQDQHRKNCEHTSWVREQSLWAPT